MGETAKKVLIIGGTAVVGIAIGATIGYAVGKRASEEEETEKKKKG